MRTDLVFTGRLLVFSANRPLGFTGSAAAAFSHAPLTGVGRRTVTMDYVFQPKVFSELKNGQAVVLLYDGLNPQPPTYCYLKPYYLDTQTSYFDHCGAGAL
jgi:hypothetical protein